MVHARFKYISLAVAVLLVGHLLPPAAAQTLKVTCPLVKPAVCIGRCSNTAPSFLTSGTCGTRRRTLLRSLQASSDTEAGKRPAQSLAPPAWALQRTAAGSSAAAGTEGPPQRYLPYGGDGSTPPETPEQQKQIAKHLDDIMSQPDPTNKQSAAAADAVDPDPPVTTVADDAGVPIPTAPLPKNVVGNAANQQQEQVQKPATQSADPSPAQSTATTHSSKFDIRFWPFWHAAVQLGNRRRVLQQEQQQTQQQPQQAATQPLAGAQQDTPTASPAPGPDTPPDANVSVLAAPGPDMPSAASASVAAAPGPPGTDTPPTANASVPQCPADMDFNATAGACTSRAAAVDTAVTRATTTPDVPVISQLTLEVTRDQQAALQDVALNKPPIDPGSEATVDLGPDGVAVAGSDKSGSSGDVTRALAPYTGPSSQVSRTLTMIGNSKIKIGVDLDRAGTISWVSSPLAPLPWKDKNIVNTWDQGRLLQQSFYGCVDASCWARRPWLWNPVQGGSWQNAPGLTLRKSVKAGAFIWAEGQGRNWGKQDLIKEVKFTTNVTLLDNVAVVKFIMSYTGTITHTYMTQEVPAVFADRKFSVLAYYNGTKPWTNDKVTYAFPPGKNIFVRPTEFWAAYIDPATGWGLGVYNPMAWMGITAYRIGPDGADSRPWDCSYFAHTIRMQLHPGMKAYPYTVYVTVGRLDAIRATFAKLRTLPAVVAASAATTAATRSITPGGSDPAATQDSPLGGQPGQPDLGRNNWYGQPLNYSAFSNILYDSVDTTPSTAAPAEGRPQQQGVGSTDWVDSAVSIGSPGAAQPAKDLTAGQVAGIVIGAVAGCALLVGAAVRHALQHRHAARGEAEADLLNSSDTYSGQVAAWSPNARVLRGLSSACDSCTASSSAARAAAVGWPRGEAAMGHCADTGPDGTEGVVGDGPGENGYEAVNVDEGPGGEGYEGGSVSEGPGRGGFEEVSVTGIAPDVTTRDGAQLQQ